MEKNIFFKALIRSKLRSSLLFFLILISSFAFVLRGIEFVAVRSQIHAVAQTYQSIVSFHPTEGFFGDISTAIPIIEQSPYVRFIDDRRPAQAFLTDMTNSDFVGPMSWSPEAGRTSTEVLFYGTWESVSELWAGNPFFFPGLASVNSGFVHRFHVDEVLMGFEEHILPGTVINVWHPLSQGSRAIYEEQSALTGQQMLVRAYRPGLVDGWGQLVNANRGIPEPLILSALNLGEEGQEPLYLKILPSGETSLDFDAFPETSHLPQLILETQINQRQIMLQGVSDIQLLPIMQGISPGLRMINGRMLTREDYLEQRPVAMIAASFAQARDLSVGDTISVRVPTQQAYDNYFSSHLGLGGGGPQLGLLQEILVSGNYEGPAEYKDLEIVGIYFFRMDGLFGRDRLNVYVPASILTNLTYTGAGMFEHWEPEHLPAPLVAFILEDSRYEQAFLTAYGGMFLEMGIPISIVSADSSFFWEMATPILTMLAFNLGLFSVLFVLVMLLLMFLYLRNHLKNFAIMRSIGISKGAVYGQLLITITLLSAPAIALGSYGAYYFGAEQISGMLETIAEFSQHMGTEGALSLTQVLLFTGIAYVTILVFTLFGAGFILSRPVLELLQGRIVIIKHKKPKNKTLKPLGIKFKNHNLQWLSHQIFRQGFKSALGFTLAFLFMFATGWVQEAMLRTSTQIDIIYDQTILNGGFRRGYGLSGFQRGGFAFNSPGFYIEGAIMGRAMREIRDFSMVENIYAQGGNIRGFVLPATHSETLPDNWAPLIGFNGDSLFTEPANIAALDFLYGFTDLDQFIQINSPDVAGVLENIHIEFKSGFDRELFHAETLDELNHRIPIIVSESTLNRRRLALGDEVVVGFTPTSFGNMQYRQAQVVGYHNGTIHGANLYGATLMSLHHLEGMFSSAMISYTTLNFTIDPSYNREITEVRSLLEALAWRSGLVPLELMLDDESLRSHITVVSQTLLLLEMLYPVAIIFSVVILSAVILLLTLQGLKNTAIMRILGNGRQKTVLLLASELVVVYGLGLVSGAVVLMFLGWGFGPGNILIIGLMYLIAVMICALFGAWLITRKSPLELLQVRE